MMQLHQRDLLLHDINQEHFDSDEWWGCFFDYDDIHKNFIINWSILKPALLAWHVLTVPCGPHASPYIFSIFGKYLRKASQCPPLDLSMWKEMIKIAEVDKTSFTKRIVKVKELELWTRHSSVLFCLLFSWCTNPNILGFPASDQSGASKRQWINGSGSLWIFGWNGSICVT